MIQKLRAFEARKSLGQNFLHDENVARKIVGTINPKPGELIIEIGPGFGVLTAHLLASGCRYVGIEIDQRLLPELQERFGCYKNFAILHADFRKIELQSLTTAATPIRLVGNIPYHITSSILFKAIREHQLLRDMILLVQREVAERVVAPPGTKNYGVLSVLSRTYAEPKIEFHVSPNVFLPKPDVESSLVRWDFSRPAKVLPAELESYIGLVKNLFQHRRKMLRKALKQLEARGSWMNGFAGDLQRRAETLSVDEFIALANALTGVRRDARAGETQT